MPHIVTAVLQAAGGCARFWLGLYFGAPPKSGSYAICHMPDHITVSCFTEICDAESGRGNSSKPLLCWDSLGMKMIGRDYNYSSNSSCHKMSHIGPLFPRFAHKFCKLP